jgi:hypothetical protein
MVRRAVLVSLLAGGLFGQGVPEDPVAKARALRTNPGDLPPVPRGVVEPPPLPPPETHPKDLKGARRSRSKTRRGKSTKGKATSKGHARRKH